MKVSIVVSELERVGFQPQEISNLIIGKEAVKTLKGEDVSFSLDKERNGSFVLYKTPFKTMMREKVLSFSPLN